MIALFAVLLRLLALAASAALEMNVTVDDPLVPAGGTAPRRARIPSSSITALVWLAVGTGII